MVYHSLIISHAATHRNSTFFPIDYRHRAWSRVTLDLDVNVLTRPIFWMTLVSLGIGSLGIGMTIASLAKSQRSASLAALCYMLVVALVLLLCQQNNIDYLPYASIEYHAPQLLHASLTNQVQRYHWFNMISCFVLALAWLATAAFLFRKRGWQ